MKHRLRRRSTLTTTAWMAGALCLASAALGQPATTTPRQPVAIPDEPQDGLEFKISGDYAHQFDSDLDEGEVGVDRFGFGIAARFEPADNFTLQLRGAYRLNDYEFSGGDAGSFAAREPWDDVHSLAFGAIVTWETTNEWSIFGGPVFEFSRESGADWGDSFIGGGVIGATYEVSDNLTIGGGVGLVSQLEESTRWYPIFIIEWRITDSLRLSTRASYSASAPPGIELIWDAGGGWEFAVGGASRFERFRLDDEGVAPDGIGEETGIPIWARASYRMNEHFSLGIFGGASFGGEFELETESGGSIDDEDYDAAPFVGVGLNVRF